MKVTYSIFNMPIVTGPAPAIWVPVSDRLRDAFILAFKNGFIVPEYDGKSFYIGEYHFNFDGVEYSVFSPFQTDSWDRCEIRKQITI